jgi:hypothetical protein
MLLKVTTQLKPVINLFRILVLAALILWAVNHSVSYFQNSQEMWNPAGLSQDAETEWEERLSALKGDLPESGVIGYVSEQDYPGISINPVDQDEEFVLTQYSLAPLILDRGNPHHDLVIGNFSAEYEYLAEMDSGLQLVFYYGKGIYLFQGVPLP